MISLAPYEYDLALSSQFYFCSLPLRFDTYSKCQFGCSYCFASTRGGARPKGLKVSNVGRLERRLRRLDAGHEPRSVVDEFLARKMPLHLGGMSDPFPPLEQTLGITAAALATLARHSVPAVVSTKGTLCAATPWIETLAAGRFLVQMSFSTFDDRLAERLEPSTPLPSERLKALQKLAAMGIPTACRLQPFLPWRLDEAIAAVRLCADVGVRHFAVEHLKLPMEDRSTERRLSEALGFDVDTAYNMSSVTRIGREWVLNVEHRLDAISQIAEAVRNLGMSFGAADSDLLHLSDGQACCSGADLLWPDVPFFRHNFATAIRKHDGGLVRRSSLDDEWLPSRSIANAINSDTRLPVQGGVSPPLKAYISENWNGGSAHATSPGSFHGVEHTGKFDSDGYAIYRLQQTLPADK